MEESAARSDVHVFTGPDVPKVFEDAYAVNVDGTLKIWRWSTRQQPKRHPVAEYAPGMWMSYHHLGQQGDEVVEAPKPPEPPRPAPRRPRPSMRDVAEHRDDSRSWTPGEEPDAEPEMSPAEREAEIRSREPGAPENLQPAVVRPSLPPKDFPVPTPQPPRRVTGSAEQTEVLPAIRNEEPQQPAGRSSMRRRTRGTWPRGAGSWVLVAIAAVSLLIGVH